MVLLRLTLFPLIVPPPFKNAKFELKNKEKQLVIFNGSVEELFSGEKEQLLSGEKEQLLMVYFLMCLEICLRRR